MTIDDSGYVTLDSGEVVGTVRKCDAGWMGYDLNANCLEDPSALLANSAEIFEHDYMAAAAVVSLYNKQKREFFASLKRRAEHLRASIKGFLLESGDGHSFTVSDSNGQFVGSLVVNKYFEFTTCQGILWRAFGMDQKMLEFEQLEEARHG